jgi:hypothetical protein
MDPGEPVDTDAGSSEPRREVRSRFSGLHSQTYEMELLASGLLVFALLQVPDWLNGQFDRLMPTVAGDWRMFVVYAWLYTQLAVTAMIVALLAHLSLRAYWIGLVGLESVYPEGTDWSKVKSGPNMLALMRSKVPPLATSIDRLDDLCSLVFSFAFLIVVSFAYSLAFVSVTGLFAWGLAAVSPVSIEAAFLWIAGLVFLLMMVISLVDRYGAHHLRPDSRASRWLAVACRFPWWVSPMRANAPIQMVLQSRLSERRLTIMMVGAMLLLTLSALVSVFSSAGVLSFSSLVYVPQEPGALGVDPRVYRSMWPAGDRVIASDRPSIDTDVVTTPFVRLVLPYLASRHTKRIGEKCPELETLRPDGIDFGRLDKPDEPAAVAAALDCFVGLHTVTLDGAPIAGLQFDWYREPVHGFPSAMAHIDVRGLSPGRHLLEIEGPWRQLDEDEDPRWLWSIPFWK